VKGNNACTAQVKLAAQDATSVCSAPAWRPNSRLESKKKADAEAVKVFADNLRELAARGTSGPETFWASTPVSARVARSWCSMRRASFVYNDVIYLLGDGNSLMHAKTLLLNLIERFKIQAIAIGNGTASRETEMFVKKIGVPSSIPVIMVNESGASIYSASDVAREEFPNHDLTVRGSVSIARRLMDPLAELVKLDPKSIGVGQYQHDVDQTMLQGSLDNIVISTVNAVGVELNTASKQLLSYVSGLNSAHAANIVAFRNEHGAFASRKDLLKVPRLGEKAFEQAAGFLRIRDARRIRSIRAPCIPSATRSWRRWRLISAAAWPI
jgi:uncharacterized protein